MKLKLASVRRQLGIAIGVTALITVTACDSDGPASPSDGALVTFQVGTEQFRVELSTREQVDAARRAQQGGPARIPNGRIVAGAGANAGWTWHLEDVTFAEVAIELCDGRPSDVERQGVQFGGGRFCPWSATVVSLVER